MAGNGSIKNLFLCLFFILGIISLSLGLQAEWAIIFGLLGFVVALDYWSRKLQADLAKLFILALICFIFGTLWFVWYLAPALNNHFIFGKYLNYQGAVKIVVHQDANQQIIVKTSLGLIQVTTAVFPPLWPGDQVKWRCSAKPVLLRQIIRSGLSASCWSDNVFLLGSKFSIARFFAQQKDNLQSVLNSRLTHPTSDLAAGLLWGDRTTLPDDLTLAFKRTGLSHVVAVSGYNFTVMLLAVGQILALLGVNKKKSWWLQLLIILAFTIFTGATASVLRAGLMATVVIVAYSLGRKTSFITVFIYALVLIALFNPAILIFDIGLQLSAGATLGLVYLSKYLQKVLAFAPNAIKETLATTIAAIISTAPIILCYFGNFSVIALLSNLLVLPMVAWDMSWSLAAIVFGWIPIIGQLVNWLAQLSVAGMIKIVSQLSAWQYASFTLQPTPLWLLLYLPVGLFSWWLIKKYD